AEAADRAGRVENGDGEPRAVPERKGGVGRAFGREGLCPLAAEAEATSEGQPRAVRSSAIPQQRRPRQAGRFGCPAVEALTRRGGVLDEVGSVDGRAKSPVSRSRFERRKRRPGSPQRAASQASVTPARGLA